MKKSDYIIFLGMVFELVGLVITLVFIGYELDKKWGHNGLWILFGAVLAIAVWIIHLVKLFKQINDKQNDNNKSH